MAYAFPRSPLQWFPNCKHGAIHGSVREPHLRDSTVVREQIDPKVSEFSPGMSKDAADIAKLNANRNSSTDTAGVFLKIFVQLFLPLIPILEILIISTKQRFQVAYLRSAGKCSCARSYLQMLLQGECS
jgi:hypothetical protein